MTKQTTTTKLGNGYWRAHGKRLRLARLVLAISEAEAAATAGVALHTYRKWEAGNRQRDNNGIKAICQKYGVYADWLVFGRPLREQ